MSDDLVQRIAAMETAILSEAREKAAQLELDGKNKMEKEKNKIYNSQREKLIQTFKKKEEELETKVKLYRSKKLNKSRLEVQKNRNNLLETLKEEAKKELLEKIKDKKLYLELLNKLILQGMIKLLEDKVIVIVKKEDLSEVENMINKLESEYSSIIKSQTNEEKSCKIEVSTTESLKEDNIGGAIIMSSNKRIVFKNTLDVRMEITYLDSIPNLRSTVFPSLNK